MSAKVNIVVFLSNKNIFKKNVCLNIIIRTIIDTEF